MAMILGVLLVGCSTKSSNAQKASDINVSKRVESVEILSVEATQIALSNHKAKSTARTIGSVLGTVGGAVAGYNLGSGRSGATIVGGMAGGALGSLGGNAVGDEKIVDGVMIEYEKNGVIYSVVQENSPCEFRQGVAKARVSGGVVSIEPNSVCR